MFLIINNNASSSSTYIVDSCDIWHGRLGHVNFSYMKKMVELSLIPKLSLENHGKFESCVKSKTTKKSCKSVERESNLLNLIDLYLIFLISPSLDHFPFLFFF